jgi:hypothetical protein
MGGLDQRRYVLLRPDVWRSLYFLSKALTCRRSPVFALHFTLTDPAIGPPLQFLEPGGLFAYNGEADDEPR